MRECRLCKSILDLSNFCFRTDCGTYRSECKSCQSINNKNYRRLNFDKIKLQKKIFRKNNIDHCKNLDKLSRERNKEQKYRYKRLKRLTSLEEFRQKDNNRYEQNREKILQRAKDSHHKHVHKMLARNALKRASKKQATPKWLSKEQKNEIVNLYKQAKLMITNDVKYHIDHIIPLKNDLVCGLHVPWNLRIISQTENCKKRNRLLLEFSIQYH